MSSSPLLAVAALFALALPLAAQGEATSSLPRVKPSGRRRAWTGRGSTPRHAPSGKS